jgi:hypothetical protein
MFERPGLGSPAPCDDSFADARLPVEQVSPAEDVADKIERAITDQDRGQWRTVRGIRGVFAHLLAGVLAHPLIGGFGIDAEASLTEQMSAAASCDSISANLNTRHCALPSYR